MCRLISFLLVFYVSLVFCNAQVNNYLYVIDETNTLRQSDIDLLESKLKTYHDSTSTQIAIRIISSLDGYDLVNYSNALASKLGIGQKGKDNGLLILVVKNDRKIRIEVGYGLEGSLPDLATKQIIDDIITPQFKNGDFYLGLDAAADDIFKRLSGEYVPAEENSVSDLKSFFYSDNAIAIPVFLQYLIVFIYFIYGIIIPYKKKPAYLKDFLGYFILFGPIYTFQIIQGFVLGDFGFLGLEFFVITIFYVLGMDSSSSGGSGGSYSGRGYSSSSSSSSSSWSSGSSYSSGGSSVGGGSFGGGGASGSW